jgi:hypothetical protein
MNVFNLLKQKQKEINLLASQEERSLDKWKRTVNSLAPKREIWEG